MPKISVNCSDLTAVVILATAHIVKPAV